jgi:phage anti-repressor protein
MNNKISFKDFLKRYTSVNNKFIDEYFYFSDQSSYAEHKIESTDVMWYLNISDKDKFHELLRKQFRNNYDYVIERTTNVKKNKVTSIKYLLSFECFKKVCMMSDTYIGEQYRDFYMKLEEFLDYYKQHITDTLNKQAVKKCMYVMLVKKGKNIFKIGKYDNKKDNNTIRKKLESFTNQSDKNSDVKFIMLVDDIEEVNKFLKIFNNKNTGLKGDILATYLKNVLFSTANFCERSKEIFKKKNDLDMHVVIDYDNIIEHLNLDDEVVKFNMPYKMVKNKKGTMLKKELYQIKTDK